MWEALAGIAGVLGALSAIIRWLLQEYFKKAKELEETKKTLQEKVLQDLNLTVDEHKKELRILGSKLEASTGALKTTDKDLQELALKLNDYYAESKTRLSVFESKLIKLTEDLFMLKGKSDGKKNN